MKVKKSLKQILFLIFCIYFWNEKSIIKYSQETQRNLKRNSKTNLNYILSIKL